MADDCVHCGFSFWSGFHTFCIVCTVQCACGFSFEVLSTLFASCALYSVHVAFHFEMLSTLLALCTMCMKIFILKCFAFHTFQMLMINHHIDGVCARAARTKTGRSSTGDLLVETSMGDSGPFSQTLLYLPDKSGIVDQHLV